MRVAEHAHGLLTRTGLSRREIHVSPTPRWAKLRDTVVDRLFSEPSLAALYDRFCPWEPRGDFSFYLPLVMSAEAVLDVGCGTRSDVEWVRGDLAAVDWASSDWDGAFDLVVMTGHAFQVFLEDDELRASFAAIRSVLTEDGRFAFETRNPPARA